MIHVYHSLEEISIADPLVTIGVFDGVHLGHQYLFNTLKERARENGWVPALITFWPHPRMILNGSAEKLRYLTTLKEKLQLLESRGIEHVVVMPFNEQIRELSACEFVQQLLIDKMKAKGLMMGFNHRLGKNRAGDYETVKACTRGSGFWVEQVNALEKGAGKVSSTLVRDLLWSGKVTLAAELLGYTYFVSGMIVSGNKMGRNLGYPTANIQPFDDHKLLPQNGVYIAEATFSGNRYFGMLNIGVRPTLSDHRQRKTIEIHLFDYHGDIYGQDVRVYFMERIRDEIKFENIEKLRDQLKKDHAFSLKWLKERKKY